MYAKYSALGKNIFFAILEFLKIFCILFFHVYFSKFPDRKKDIFA